MVALAVVPPHLTPCGLGERTDSSGEGCGGRNSNEKKHNKTRSMWCRDGCAASVDRHRRHAHPRCLPAAGTAQGRPTDAARLALASAVTCTGIGFLIAPAHFSDDLVRYDPPHWNLLAVLAASVYVSRVAATLVVLARLHVRQGDMNHSLTGEERPLVNGDRVSQAVPGPLPQSEQSPVRRPAATAVRRAWVSLRRGGLRRVS